MAPGPLPTGFSRQPIKPSTVSFRTAKPVTSSITVSTSSVGWKTAPATWAVTSCSITPSKRLTFLFLIAGEYEVRMKPP